MRSGSGWRSRSWPRRSASRADSPFSAERQILAQLEHPFIARLIDGGTTGDGLPYLVMEFVEGVRSTSMQGAPSDGTRAAALFRSVCDAVQYAHRHLVVHRDLKPQNILVGGRQPKLLDFGIASLVSDDDDPVARDPTGVAAMTPEYASPEQIRGERVTAASDIYSLGVLLYELLSGVRPHDLKGKGADEILARSPTPIRRGPARRRPVPATNHWLAAFAATSTPSSWRRFARSHSGATRRSRSCPTMCGGISRAVR